MTLLNIPYHIPEGKYRCRCINLLDNKTKEDWHVFSVLEMLEPDMQDYRDPVLYEHATSSGKNTYKLYFTSCDIDVTSAFISNPIENFCLDVGRGPFKVSFFNKHFEQVPDGKAYYTFCEGKSKGIGRILPKRKGSFFVKVYFDPQRDVLKVLEVEEYLKKQIKELSEKHFGVDLYEFKEHIGNSYLLWHDKVFKGLQIKANNHPYGVIVDVVYRSHVRKPFKLRITDRQQGDCMVADYEWNIPQGANSIFIPLEAFPALCDISAYSEDGMLLYKTESNYFVSKIVTNIGVCEKAVTVSIKEENGTERTLPPVNKFTYIDSFIGSKKDNANMYFADNERFHKIKEMADSREFIFFDGSKTEEDKQQNKDEAKKAVLDILRRARSRCYICDPYFNEKNFIEFITPLESLNTKIRIINSKADVGNANLVSLSQMISRYNAELGISDHVLCRVLKGGSSRLHDRFIIADHQVWYLGSSFSEFGGRACSLAKLSDSAAMCVKSYVEEWWNSEDITMPISGISLLKKEKKKSLRRKVIECLRKISDYIKHYDRRKTY